MGRRRGPGGEASRGTPSKRNALVSPKWRASRKGAEDAKLRFGCPDSSLRSGLPGMHRVLCAFAVKLCL